MSASPEDRVSATPARVELALLGRTVTIRTEASPEYLRSLADDVEQRVAAIEGAGVRDRLTAVALVALDIADELHRARAASTRDADDVRARLDVLLGLLGDVTA